VAGELAAQGASGALEISGDPGGTSYLTEGYLTFAESAAVPDLGSRLVNSRRVLVDQWSRADQDSQPDGCAGDLLIDRGLIDPREWQTVLRSAALDALLSLAIGIWFWQAFTGTWLPLRFRMPSPLKPVGPLKVAALATGAPRTTSAAVVTAAAKTRFFPAYFAFPHFNMVDFHAHSRDAPCTKRNHT
jgi:hypothetical protein